MARDNNPMDDRELVAFLAHKIEASIGDEDGEVSYVRQQNFRSYYGMPYGDEEDGRSQFVTRQAFEAVEWAIPSVLRFFAGNDNAVEFEPLAENDEEAAGIETDIVKHYVQRRNKGFYNLYCFTKDVLMNPTAYMKVWAEEYEETKHEFFAGATAIDLQAIEENPDAEIIEASGPYQKMVQLPDGPIVNAELYDVKLTVTRQANKIKVEALPPDEVLIDDGHYSPDLDECEFVCHRNQKSISQLVKMGFDQSRLERLGEPRDPSWSDERTTRLFYEEEQPEGEDEDKQDGPTSKLWVHECYVDVDFDGDGVAERRRVLLIGDEVFENETVSYQPIIATSAIIIPHKHVGMGYIEAVEDLQLVGTVVTRQLLDNVYAHNDKRHYMDEKWLLADNSTMDNYLDASSTLILGRGNPAEHVMPEQTTPLVNELLQVLEHFDNQAQMRTGVAPQLSLDPAVLKDSTMGAFMGALDQASQRLETLVRIIGETAIAPLYQKVHHLMRQYRNEPISLKIRGTWQNADPQTWKEREDVLVNVGLGHTNKQLKIQLLMQLFGIQKEMQPGGLVNPMQLFNTIEDLVEASGVGSVNRYFTEPDPQKGWQPPQPQPTAQDQAILTQAQAMMTDANSKVAMAQVKARETDLKAQEAVMKIQADFARFREEAAAKQRESEAKLLEANNRLRIDGATALANIRNTNEDSQLKDAQRQKTLAETDGKVVDTERTAIENSEEMQLAREVIGWASEEEDAETSIPTE